MQNSNRFLTLGAALALFATACDADKVTEANQNPNNPTDAPSSALFTNAARIGVVRWQDGVGGVRFGFLPQHLAEVQYPESDQYVRLSAAATTGLFDGSYNTELQDLQIVFERGVAGNQGGLSGPARVLKSWEFGILTDVFGDVPYSEAFDPAVLRPNYDAQQAIYTDLFAQLAQASTELGTGTNVLGTGDPIYAGDPVAWRRFANSLRARHALRLVNVDAATANTQLTAAFSDAGGLIATNAQNAKMDWPGDGIYDNPWAANFKTRDDHRISTRLLTHLRDLQDPRLFVYAMPAGTDQPELPGQTLRYCPATIPTLPSGTPPGSGCWVGLTNALTHPIASSLLPYTSRVGATFFPGVTAYGTFGGGGTTFPSFLMTAAEVEFIRAEAAQRNLGGLTPAQAAGFYNAGITRSMEMWGISAASIAAYLAQPLVAYTPGNAGLVQIATQKWLALYIDPIQAWAEVRRTCRPANVEPGPNAIENILPRRLRYSNTEQAVNAANRQEAIERQGADNFRTRMYWDQLAGWQNSPTYVAGCSDRTL
jgi:hypothetical protein